MKVKLLENGIMPTRAHFDDAGIDFYTPEGFTLKPHDSYLLDLKVSVEIPIGYYGKMESKSGLMTKHGVVCAGGVIDSGFRGSIMVRMENHSDVPYEFRAGDKAVQMVLIPCLLATLEQTDKLDDSDSGRGESGWGSTGK